MAPVTDGDLGSCSHQELIEELMKLRDGIRRHRDCRGNDLCWHHPALWSLLPEATDAVPEVPAWPDFLKGCIRYRISLDQQLPSAPRKHEEYKNGG